MRLVYFGTSGFALPALRALSDHVVLVVTQPDRPAGRGRHPRASPVKQAATELGLRVETPQKAKDPEFIEKVRSLEADALLVAAYGQILPQELLDSSKRGGINLHASVLPRFRGAAPIQRAILEGEGETGVTLMQMDRGMDTGDIIAIERMLIEPDETAGELESRLARLAADIAVDCMPRIVDGDYPRTPQDDAASTLAPKITKTDAELRFDQDVRTAYDRFRACTPRPGAWLRTSAGTLRLHKARMDLDAKLPPGAIADADDLAVAFKFGGLRLLEVQPEGKARMTGRDFANGKRLKPGDRLLP